MCEFICIESLCCAIVTVELNWPFLRQLWFQKKKKKMIKKKKEKEKKEWCPLTD